MNTPYIYESSKNSEFAEATSAILMMPDIYGQSDYANATVEELATKFGQPVYMLDYFYQLTSQPTIISDANRETAHELMDKMTGDEFIKFFAMATSDILAERPALQHFTVVGFCFAGRLAYLAGVEPKVNKIVSFYGAGAHTQGYAQGLTPIQYLAAKRGKDANLKIISFYGSQDASIPESDRAQTKAELAAAGISYTEKVYDAGHAYFQPGRDNYTEAAATSSWQELTGFMQ